MTTEKNPEPGESPAFDPFGRADLIADIKATADKLDRDEATRGDLKGARRGFSASCVMPSKYSGPIVAKRK